MGMVVEGKAGVQSLADGGAGPLRQGHRGELIVQAASGRFQEAVRRGNVYAVSVGAAGVAPGAAIDTTAELALYNPEGSGKRLVLLRASLAYISGTLPAGAVLYCANAKSSTGPSGGSALSPVNALVGAAAASAAQAKSGATLVATPSLLRPMASLAPILATSVVAPWMLTDDLDGEFVIEQGGAFSIQTVAAGGTTPLIVCGLVWEEVPV